MTVQMDHAPAVQMDHPPAPPVEADWDLDITFVESGGVVDDLLRLTDDGCGTTCQSACTSCP